MTVFRSLRQYCNVMATAHIEVKEDEKTKQRYREVSITGKMKIGFIRYWPNVFEMEVSAGQGRMRTRGEDERYIARTTMPLDLYEPANIAAVLAKAEKAESQRI